MSMMATLVPRRFEHASFDNFETASESQTAARAAVQAWLQAKNDGAMLALVGKQGIGKSHLLYAAVRELLGEFEAIDPKERTRLQLQAPYVASWYRLAEDLRWGRTAITEGGSRSIEAPEVRAAMWGRRVVLIDEVRVTSTTNFDDTELAKFACHAYDNRIAVLITTNVHPLAMVMGEAAASRFRQVFIEGPDARQS